MSYMGELMSKLCELMKQGNWVKTMPWLTKINNFYCVLKEPEDILKSL